MVHKIIKDGGKVQNSRRLLEDAAWIRLETRVQVQRLPLPSSLHCWVLCSTSDSYLVCQVQMTVPTVTVMTTPPHGTLLYFPCVSLFNFWVYPHWPWWEAYIRNLSGVPSPDLKQPDGGHGWWQPPPSKALLRSGGCGSTCGPVLPVSVAGIFVAVPKTTAVSFQTWQRSVKPLPLKTLSPECLHSGHSGEPEPSLLPHLTQWLSTCNAWNQKAIRPPIITRGVPASSFECL